MTRYAGHTPAEIAQFRAEALKRFPPSSHDRWTRMCLLLEETKDLLSHGGPGGCLSDDSERICAACDLESRIDHILSEEV